MTTQNVAPAGEETSMAPANSVLSLDSVIKITDDIKHIIVPVPEWGGEVRLGTLSAEDAADFLEAVQDPRKKRVAGLRLLVLAIEDADGKRVDRTKIDAYVGLIGKRSAAVVNRLINEVTKFNGLDKAQVEERKNESGGAESSDSLTA
jgi:hypothetical protein